jgi:glycosyl transferase family 25
MTIPPLFVISLAGSRRRAAVQQRLADWPGPWSFFDAIDGSKLTEQEIARLCDQTLAVRRIGRRMTAGEIGCALSHRAIYARIVERGLDRALILEDDAIPTQALLDFPFDDPGVPFDVISFYCHETIVRRVPARHIGRTGLHRVVGKCLSGAAYLVSRAGAEKLLNYATPISTIADWPCYPQDIRFWLTRPYLATTDNSPSDIDAMQRRTGAVRETDYPLVARLVGRLPLWISNPLFLRYALHRGCYVNLYDFYWREIDADLRMFCPLYRRIK